MTPELLALLQAVAKLCQKANLATDTANAVSLPSCRCRRARQQQAQADVLALDVFANDTIEGEPDAWRS